MQNDAYLSAIRTLKIEKSGLDALEEALGDFSDNGLGRQFSVACGLLCTAGRRIILTGIGKSGHIGRKIAATFASTGTPAYFVHPSEASHGDMGMIQQGDVIVALSWSGETSELADIITYSRRFAVPLIAITSNVDSSLGKQADICLELPKIEEACPHGLAPTTSTTLQLVLGDALAMALLEGRGFTASDFRQYHPGGKLGARLTLVRDVMHQGDQLPVIDERSSMSDALVTMSKQGFGCVGVLDADGRLVGMITDGDMRRAMRPDLMIIPVAEVMTRKPLTITSGTLAAEALNILQTKRISALFVVDGAKKPIGLVHFHDLLRLGVA